MRGRHRRAAARHREPVELNITAFMNLMVVLVPFLLVMAVFSRIAILELNLPSGAGGQTDEPEAFSLTLEVVVRADRLVIQDRNEGLLSELPMTDAGEQDLAGLSDYLQRVKAEYPDVTAVTVLLEPEIPYELVVAVMDTVRLFRSADATGVQLGELFPDISIGDAPRTAGENAS
jgi:biopolymer transport protein ExbD